MQISALSIALTIAAAADGDGDGDDDDDDGEGGTGSNTALQHTRARENTARAQVPAGLLGSQQIPSNEATRAAVVPSVDGPLDNRTADSASPTAARRDAIEASENVPAETVMATPRSWTNSCKQRHQYMCLLSVLVSVPVPVPVPVPEVGATDEGATAAFISAKATSAPPMAAHAPRVALLRTSWALLVFTFVVPCEGAVRTER
jgi:hypothetical protein